MPHMVSNIENACLNELVCFGNCCGMSTYGTQDVMMFTCDVREAGGLETLT